MARKIVVQEGKLGSVYVGNKGQHIGFVPAEALVSRSPKPLFAVDEEGAMVAAKSSVKMQIRDSWFSHRRGTDDVRTETFGGMLIDPHTVEMSVKRGVRDVWVCTPTKMVGTYLGAEIHVNFCYYPYLREVYVKKVSQEEMAAIENMASAAEEEARRMENATVTQAGVKYFATLSGSNWPGGKYEGVARILANGHYFPSTNWAATPEEAVVNIMAELPELQELENNSSPFSSIRARESR